MQQPLLYLGGNFMSSLKNKLAQKIEDKDEIKEDSMILEENNNVILLNSNDNKKISSQEIIPQFVVSINEAKERISMLQSFVKEMMVSGIDYGVIPNSKKPSLFKAGAEKLCDIFGFSKQLDILNRVEDWDKGLFHYEVKAILINKRTGFIEAEGVGSCNSREKKFKNQDSYSITNTILKMAKKRALIDAVLSATRSSGIFTQDIEDYDSQNLSKINKNFNNKAKEEKIMITREQQTQIILTMSQNKIPVEEAKQLMYQRYNVNESKMLTTEQANEFIDLLKCISII